jgi:hypothetical protein
MNWTKLDLRILIRGANNVDSAVAHCLLQTGYGVVIHDSTQPTTTRRRKAFTDAVFYGNAILDDIYSSPP